MDYVAIIAGAFAVMALGFAWFHPALFGKSWMRGAGLTEEDMKGGNPLVMVGALLMAAVIAYAFSRYVHPEPGMHQFVHGGFHGLMNGLLYVAPVLISKGLFEKKDLGWILLGTAYWVLAIALVAGIVYWLTPLAPAAG